MSSETLGRTHLEESVENFLRRRVLLVGGYSIKLAPVEKGIPDRLVMMPGGRMYLVELKTKGGALSSMQRHWHAKIRANQQIPVHVLWNREQVVDFIRTIKGEPTLSRRSSTRRPAPRR